MINIKELKGNVFKKEFGLNRCMFEYHNKNKSGGNFGLNFYLNKDFDEDTDFTLHGDYNINGEIFNLKIMSIRVGGFIINIPKEKRGDWKELIDYIKGFYEHINKKIVIRGLR